MDKNRKMKVSLGRHKRACSVCRHLKLAEIEAEFVSWRSPASIAEEYGYAFDRKIWVMAKEDRANG